MSISGYLDCTKGLLYTGKLHRLSMPIEIYLEVTNVCNLNCAYCYKRGLNTGLTKFLSPKLIGKVLNEVERNTSEPTLFILEGGEPFLHPQIADIIEMIKGFGYPIDILTNGTLFQESIVKQLSRIMDFSKDEIQISLDGLNDDSRKNRNEDPIEVINGIKRLNTHGIAPRINSVLTVNNVSSILDFLDYVSKNLEITSVTISSVFGKGNDSLVVDMKQKEALLRELEKRSFSFQLYKNFTFQSCSEQLCNRTFERASSYYKRCTALCGKICIATNGDVYPCALYEGKMKPIGSICDNSLIEIWNSDKSGAFLNWQSEISKECVYCANNQICSQKCAGSMDI